LDNDKLQIKLEIPLDSVMKEKQKNDLISDFATGMAKKGIQNISLSDSYYLDKRSAAEPIGYLVLFYLSSIADIVSIVIAIWSVLKERRNKKEVTINIGKDIFVKVNGDMSEKAIIELVKQAKKQSAKKEK